jgi:hypothetical protein
MDARGGCGPVDCQPAVELQAQTDTLRPPALGKEYLGLTELDATQEHDLVSALEVQAQDAAHTDDLVQAARHWLFTRRILIPSIRRLLDWARDAFAKIEAQIVICVADAVGRANAARLLLAVHAPRPGTDVSRIEWLKTPPRRHNPTMLAETLEKVRYLKALGVHEWDLSGVVLARQQAYARQIQARRPYRSRDIRIAAQLVEVVCFLHVTLLELTDTALHLASRRAQQLVRSAAERARTRTPRKARVSCGRLRLPRRCCTTAPSPGRSECCRRRSCWPRLVMPCQ